MGLREAMEYARQELADLEGDPGYVISPDGACERSHASRVVRNILARLSPDEWCPPHYFDATATYVRGQALLTCEMCGVSFTGSWTDSGYRDRPEPRSGVPAA